MNATKTLGDAFSFAEAIEDALADGRLDWNDVGPLLIKGVGLLGNVVTNIKIGGGDKASKLIKRAGRKEARAQRLLSEAAEQRKEAAE